MVRIPELPPDETFPQLGLVTDPEPMRALLQRELPGYTSGDLRIESLKIERFQYRPRKRCSICYSLRVRAPEAREGTQILYGLLDGKGRARARYEQGRNETRFEPEFAPALHYLSELDMVVWGFPNDPAMHRLHELLDRDRFLGIVGQHAEALGLSGREEWGGLDTRVAKYVPGNRCVLEHRLWPADGVESGPGLHVYTKSYDGGRAARIFETMRQLWESDGRRRGDLAMPEPLAYDEERHTIFQRPVPGLGAVAKLGKPDLPALTPGVARLLASIHTARIGGLSERTARHDLTDLAKARSILAAAGPETAQWAGSLVARLEDRIADTEGLPATPLHGAFRLSQLLLVGEQLVLLDFDGLVVGNPLRDVGSLCAHLLYQPVKGSLGREPARRAIASFCDAYRAAAPWGIPERSLRWYTAAELVSKHAKKCVKRAKKASDRKIAELLGTAEAVLEGREPLR